MMFFQVLSKVKFCNLSGFLHEVATTNSLTSLEKIWVCGFCVKKGPKRVRNGVFQILTKITVKSFSDFLHEVQWNEHLKLTE